MGESRKLIIVQPYVPKYRVAFFSRLVEVLADENITCRVAAAPPSPDQALRGDAATEEWVVPVRYRQMSWHGRTVTLGGAGATWADADGLIVGHLGSSLDTYRALLKVRKGRTELRTGLWGHIKSYVSKSNPLDAALERWQLRQADHVFAYTPGGTEYAASVGVGRDRLTTVMNSVDTEALFDATAALTAGAVERFTLNHALTAGRTLAFLGGLDESKRIDFLASALESLWQTDPDVKLIVGGRGGQSNLLDASVARGQTILLGYAGPQEQALIGRTASALVMPGRIGLVAVDALLMKLPILTTNWPYHSAEAEYLTEGLSRFTSSNDVESFADLCRSFLASNCQATPRIGQEWDHPTLDSMVQNFAAGVRRMMADS